MFEFLLDVYTIRILLAMIMLLIASLIDIWKREINDALWIGFAAIAIVLIFIEPDLIEILKNIGISLIIAPVALVIWRIGIFGGADALGLIVLAALAPQANFSDGVITPFTTLTNAAIFSVIPIFTNLIRNIMTLLNHNSIFDGFDETRSKKTLAIFLGYRAKNPKYGFSIEKTEGDHKKLDFSLKHAEKAEFCNKPDTWITPSIPYILYITAGFVAQVIFGDVILTILSNVW